jgi:ArsR family transcriptional regulator
MFVNPLQVSEIISEQALPVHDAAARNMAALFSALADPTRVRIISLLLDGDVCVHDIQKALGMTQSAVSHQLRLLRDLRVVRARRDGRHIFYALDDMHVRILYLQSLEHIRHKDAQRA